MSDLDDLDVPATHLDDEAYDEFVASNFGGDGSLKSDPPIGLWILLAIGLVLVVAVFVLT